MVDSTHLSPTTRLAFSPDGRYIAYDFQASQGSPTRCIFSIAVDGSRELPVTEAPAKDELFGWAPDGAWLLFASDRGGKRQLWAAPMSDGKVQGRPILVKRDLGEASPLGFDRKGTFYYCLKNLANEAYLADIDWNLGRISAPRPLTQRFVGANFAPSFSPDGTHLAYLSQRGAQLDPSAHVIVDRIMASGKEREIQPDIAILPGLGTLQWSPDGRSLLTLGTSTKTGFGVYAVNLDGGSSKPLILDQAPFSINAPAWFPDGRSIVCWHVDRRAQPRVSKVVVHDLESGSKRELLPSSGYPAPGGNGRGIALSPDGGQLAFGATKGTQAVLATAAVAGGTPKELMATNGLSQILVRGWSADSRYVMFTLRTLVDAERKQYTSELRYVGAAGGASRKLEGLEGLNEVEYLSIHPGNRQLAFSTGGVQTEIWIMENLVRSLGTGH